MLLAWFAMQQKSLFAAKCLVEAVTEAYRDGYTLDDIKMSLSLSGGPGELLSVGRARGISFGMGN